MKKLLFVLSFTILGLNSFAQVGIGTALPNPSAELDVFSIDKGLLLPRVALVQTTNFAPLLSHVAGMLVYNTATQNDIIPGQYYNDGTKWILVGSSAGIKNYAFLRSSDDLPAETIGDQAVSAYRVGQTVIGNVDKTGNIFYGSSPVSVVTPSPAKVAFSVVNQFTTGPTPDGRKIAGQFVNLANPPAGSSANDARAIVGRTFSSPTSNANYEGLYGGSISATHVGTGVVDTAFGLLANVRNSTTGNASRIVNANGADFAVQNDGTAVIQVVKGNSLTTTNNGTITTNHGLYIDRTGGVPLLGLGNYTTNYGIRVRDQSLGTTATGYGLYIDDVKATTDYGVYQAGADDVNYFNGNVGIKTLLPKAELEVAGTGAIIVPIGTTAQRPTTPVKGMIRFNSELEKFEGYNGTNWNVLD